MSRVHSFDFIIPVSLFLFLLTKQKNIFFFLALLKSHSYSHMYAPSTIILLIEKAGGKRKEDGNNLLTSYVECSWIGIR